MGDGQGGCQQEAGQRGAWSPTEPLPGALPKAVYAVRVQTVALPAPGLQGSQACHSMSGCGALSKGAAGSGFPPERLALAALRPGEQGRGRRPLGSCWASPGQSTGRGQQTETGWMALSTGDSGPVLW